MVFRLEANGAMPALTMTDIDARAAADAAVSIESDKGTGVIDTKLTRRIC